MTVGDQTQEFDEGELAFRIVDFTDALARSLRDAQITIHSNLLRILMSRADCRVFRFLHREILRENPKISDAGLETIRSRLHLRERTT